MKKLYKRNYSTDKLVEIGCSVVEDDCDSPYQWKLYLPKPKSNNISEAISYFEKGTYYPYWLAGTSEENVIDVFKVLDGFCEEIYASSREVIGISNPRLSLNWYYADLEQELKNDFVKYVNSVI